MLNSVDYEAKHRKLQNLRHAGTGEWLFQEAAYVTWRRIDNSAAICCRGIRESFYHFYFGSKLMSFNQLAVVKLFLRT